ncbi:MAG: tRNA (adenosine(37)-N6)-dimethylallyltransferase MiaA [Oceanicaulis sp.]|uniref:tRNA (adenosine(37)-N6)-dimethylallyltransferase MiaA n=1 Tax=Glycocaulis sp. TaxID=1969725 RepID=UPI0025C20672|nr:tRNA (adenosine(37)-N6)-dimethylallyltransferase MiaA [Glycocaulis sp.]MCC5981955.1 tRNA (adenosine(37)-N6)-dimethylallyltransferase MiaA [Oceanicaulis sp.]MCH8521200.1 tRNA (adenosine(37)-N6)-dimethylallyltransferase MiaA [Glycocaulis sp.]
MVRPAAILLAGPTASGKTALAVKLAKTIGAEIINADSMQLYQGLAILSAQPSQAERGDVPHHLFAHTDPSERWSAGRWAEAALGALSTINARGAPAIFVGGTGLYFKVLTQGLAPVSPIPSDIRESTIELAGKGYAALRERASELDPVGAARIKPGDTQRLVRLIEVVTATGRTMAEVHAETRPLLPETSWTGFVLQPERAGLYARIEARFEAMMAAGALDEARALHARGLDRNLPAMKAVGLRPLLAHLDGEMTLEEAVVQGKTDSRRYAKRQFTWFSNQHGGWPRLPTDNAEAALKTMLQAIEKEG